MAQHEVLAQQALQALGKGEVDNARAMLEEALSHERRPDIVNALGVVMLQLGEPEKALVLLQESVDGAWENNAEPHIIAHFTLGLAAAYEDNDRPLEALEVYERVLDGDAHNPRAVAGQANLKLSMGRLGEGVAELKDYIAQAKDEEMYLEAAQSFIDALDKAESEGFEPRTFLLAHRESYVGFFDEKANEMAQKGWIAECARMHRNDAGEVVPLIPDGARPYAAVRVDLVDPSTGGAGQIGDQPMVVAVAGYEALARAPIALKVEGVPFDLRVSTQCPWDQLAINVLVEDGDAVELVEPELAAWYTDGYNGRFGTKEAGRFHYISDPIPSRGGRGLTVHVDLGRANMLALESLVDRLVHLNQRHPLAQVLLGRGHLDA